MPVASNTSPLNYLILCDAIDALPVLFDTVHVPEQVIDELLDPSAPAVVRTWSSVPPAWLHVTLRLSRIPHCGSTAEKLPPSRWRQRFPRTRS
jgi:hypothetical protein